MDEVLDTKDQVIKSAIDLFSTKGFNGTSIRAIADAMGMSISNIYHHYKSKEGLLLAILAHSTIPLLEELGRVSERNMDPLERFKLLLQTHLRQAASRKKESKIFFLDEDHLSQNGNEINKKFQRDVLNIYIKELKNLNALGYIKSTNLTILAFNILSLINWFLRWYRPEGSLSQEQVIEEIVSFQLHGALGCSTQDPKSV
jgi:AcrR family transcriptional regulator